MLVQLYLCSLYIYIRPIASRSLRRRDSCRRQTTASDVLLHASKLLSLVSFFVFAAARGSVTVLSCSPLDYSSHFCRERRAVGAMRKIHSASSRVDSLESAAPDEKEGRSGFTSKATSRSVPSHCGRCCRRSVALDRGHFAKVRGFAFFYKV